MTRRTLLACGLALAVLSSLSAQTPPNPYSDQWANKLFGPPENRTHDFGMVKHGDILTHDYVVTNTFPYSIEILGVRASMGPTHAWATKQLLQPNEKTTIKIEVDTRRFVGPKAQTIWVEFSANAPTGSNGVPVVLSEVQLRLRANAVNEPPLADPPAK